MRNKYDKYLQEESLDWLEDYDEETTDGYLEEIEDEKNKD